MWIQDESSSGKPAVLRDTEISTEKSPQNSRMNHVQSPSDLAAGFLKLLKSLLVKDVYANRD